MLVGAGRLAMGFYQLSYYWFVQADNDQIDNPRCVTHSLEEVLYVKKYATMAESELLVHSHLRICHL